MTEPEPRAPIPGRRDLRRNPKAWVGGLVAGLALLALSRALSRDAGPGEFVIAAGQAFATGVPVITYRDENGYSAYRRGKWFDREEEPDGELRFAPIRSGISESLRTSVERSGWKLPDLQQVVHLFVLHFDVAGTARRCFRILQDKRNLSVHFLLDTDGTLYQTLDLQEQAWHATIANRVSIGIEIAHPGVWRRPRHPDMLRWYAKDDQGWYMRFPPEIQETGLRTPDFIPRPDRAEQVQGSIHGTDYYQFDFTPEQYRTLAHLIATLHEVFPRIRIEAPRDADGNVRTDQLSEAELMAFEGIVGHHHVQRNKTDPGPAMQWDRLLADARALFAERQRADADR